MKKYIFLVVITCLFIAKAAVAQKISVSYENTPLHTVLKDLRKKTGMGYTIDADCLEQSNTITLKADNVPLKEILKKISAESATKFRISGNTILMAPDIRPVYGRVIDQNEEPIADVMVRAGTLATITNNRGEFYIRPAACDRILKFFHAGDSTVIRLGKMQNIIVRMKTPIAVNIN
jgi:hypothetical protein